MKKQFEILTLAAILCCGVHSQAAELPVTPVAQVTRDEAQQLLKDRDAARAKAEAAEKKMREAGAADRLESLGFKTAKALRDQQAASGTKKDAHDRYVQTARKIEMKMRFEIERGVRAPLEGDIARFELLQAEVDLARVDGRLPADGK